MIEHEATLKSLQTEALQSLNSRCLFYTPNLHSERLTVEEQEVDLGHI